MSYREYRNCIDACMECVDVCNHCASECLKEPNAAHMSRCVQLDLECAAICYAAAQLMSLGSQYARQLCGLCAMICRECADECKMHNNAHCRECAEICMECAEECTQMLDQ